MLEYNNKTTNRIAAEYQTSCHFGWPFITFSTRQASQSELEIFFTTMVRTVSGVGILNWRLLF